jgi:predicted transcriptional regulator
MCSVNTKNKTVGNREFITQRRSDEFSVATTTHGAVITQRKRKKKKKGKGRKEAATTSLSDNYAFS